MPLLSEQYVVIFMPLSTGTVGITQWFSRSGCWNRPRRRGPAVVASWRSSVYCKDLRSGGSRHHGRSSQCRRCFYYPGTEEAHTNPTRQRGECLRALAGASG